MWCDYSHRDALDISRMRAHNDPRNAQKGSVEDRLHWRSMTMIRAPMPKEVTTVATTMEVERGTGPYCGYAAVRLFISARCWIVARSSEPTPRPIITSAN